MHRSIICLLLLVCASCFAEGHGTKDFLAILAELDLAFVPSNKKENPDMPTMVLHTTQAKLVDKAKPSKYWLQAIENCQNKSLLQQKKPFYTKKCTPIIKNNAPSNDIPYWGKRCSH